MAPSADDIRELFEVHNSEFARSERLLRSYGLDAQRLWVREGGYRLSDSVWRARAQTRTQIDAVLRQAIADGADALEVARILEDHLNPALSPVRNVRGRIVRNQPRGVVTRAPGRAGMGSFAARRLARTEITRAHGAATMWAAERTPFAVGVKWSTSGRHPKADECDAKAERDTGLGAGVYAVKDVPRYPSHPQCLCVLSTATVDDVDAVVAGLRDKYGLGEAQGSVATVDGPQDLGTWKPVRTEPDARAWARASGGTLADETFYHFTKEEFVDSIKREGLRKGGGSVGEYVYTTSQGTSSGIAVSNVPTRLRLVTNATNPLRVNYDDLWHKKKGLGRYKITQRDVLYSDKFPAERVQELLGADGYDALIIEWEGASFGSNRGEWLLVMDPKKLAIIEEAS